MLARRIHVEHLDAKDQHPDAGKIRLDREVHEREAAQDSRARFDEGRQLDEHEGGHAATGGDG